MNSLRPSVVEKPLEDCGLTRLDGFLLIFGGIGRLQPFLGYKLGKISLIILTSDYFSMNVIPESILIKGEDGVDILLAERILLGGVFFINNIDRETSLLFSFDFGLTKN